MDIERIETDELLNKLRYIISDKDKRSPFAVNESMDHIQHQLGDDLYRSIEDDISLIMDRYEERGFNMGFRSSFKIVLNLMKT